MHQPGVVLTSLGNFQQYITDNIQQLCELGYDVCVITERHYFPRLSHVGNIKLIDVSDLCIETQVQRLRLDTRYRGGFWHHASARFFALRAYMNKHNVRHIIHLENDVLLYTKMLHEYDDCMWITMDHPGRCIPGIMYIPDVSFMDDLCDNYKCDTNDMENLAAFYNRHKTVSVKTFPLIDQSFRISMYNENYTRFNSVFDAAAMGQYLGGVDPQNISGDSSGFVNETCEIKYDRYKFKWIQKGEYSFPYMSIDNKLIAINNLHIHCKRVEKFRMVNPAENEYIRNG